MRPAAATFFKKYSIEHEGFTSFPYCDTLNLVTTGIGNLRDSGPRNGFDVSPSAMASFVSMPWKIRGVGWTNKNPTSAGLASFDQKVATFTQLKNVERDNPGFNKKGGFAYAGLTNLTLDLDDIQNIVASQTASNESILRKEYPNYDRLCADVQVGLNSMAWAMGAAFWPVLTTNGVPTFQAFKDAIDAEDFEAAAVHSQFAGGGRITDPLSRNHDLDIMFRNAAQAKKAGADPDLLFFPGTGPSSASGGGSKVAGGIPGLLTPTNVVGGGLAAGLIGWGLYEWNKDRKKDKSR